MRGRKRQRKKGYVRRGVVHLPIVGRKRRCTDTLSPLARYLILSGMFAESAEWTLATLHNNELLWLGRDPLPTGESVTKRGEKDREA